MTEKIYNLNNKSYFLITLYVSNSFDKSISTKLCELDCIPLGYKKIKLSLVGVDYGLFEFLVPVDKIKDYIEIVHTNKER